ncbi:MoaD/ThiS family protein [Lutibacter sp.]
MKIKVLLFGIVTDLIGENEIVIYLPPNSTVENLRLSLALEYAKLGNIHEFAVAVNEEYAENNRVLKATDVVAIIPPVSGG